VFQNAEINVVAADGTSVYHCPMSRSYDRSISCLQTKGIVFEYMLFQKPNDIITDFSVICFGAIIESF
jgi:hypothetical protein